MHLGLTEPRFSSDRLGRNSGLGTLTDLGPGAYILAELFRLRPPRRARGHRGHRGRRVSSSLPLTGSESISGRDL